MGTFGRIVCVPHCEDGVSVETLLMLGTSWITSISVAMRRSIPGISEACSVRHSSSSKSYAKLRSSGVSSFRSL